MKGVELKQEIIDAIQRCCAEKDKEEIKKYFGDTLISEMIDDAFEG